MSNYFLIKDVTSASGYDDFGGALPIDDLYLVKEEPSEESGEKKSVTWDEIDGMKEIIEENTGDLFNGCFITDELLRWIEVFSFGILNYIAVLVSEDGIINSLNATGHYKNQFKKDRLINFNDNLRNGLIYRAGELAWVIEEETTGASTPFDVAPSWFSMREGAVNEIREKAYEPTNFLAAEDLLTPSRLYKILCNARRAILVNGWLIELEKQIEAVRFVYKGKELLIKDFIVGDIADGRANFLDYAPFNSSSFGAYWTSSGIYNDSSHNIEYDTGTITKSFGKINLVSDDGRIPNSIKYGQTYLIHTGGGPITIYNSTRSETEDDIVYSLDTEGGVELYIGSVEKGNNLSYIRAFNGSFLVVDRLGGGANLYRVEENSHGKLKFVKLNSCFTTGTQFSLNGGDKPLAAAIQGVYSTPEAKKLYDSADISGFQDQSNHIEANPGNFKNNNIIAVTNDRDYCRILQGSRKLIDLRTNGRDCLAAIWERFNVVVFTDDFSVFRKYQVLAEWAYKEFCLFSERIYANGKFHNLTIDDLSNNVIIGPYKYPMYPGPVPHDENYREWVSGIGYVKQYETTTT